MSTALWIGVGIFAIGFALRFWARQPFLAAYQRRHDARPPRNWPWTSSDDPEVERWRRLTLLGTVLLWTGAVFAFLNAS